MRPEVNRANQALLAHYVRWAMERLYFDEEYIFWTYLPASLALLDRLGVPEAPATPGRSAGRAPAGGRRPPPLSGGLPLRGRTLGLSRLRDPEVVRRYDDELTRRADLVVTTAENLRRSREALNPHTYTVLNAADVEIFGRALDPGSGPAQPIWRPSRLRVWGWWACTTPGSTSTHWRLWPRPRLPGRSCSLVR